MEPRKCGARVPRAVAVLAGLLERAAERGDAEGAPPASLSAFRGKALPAIPVRRYAERIYRYAGCSPACFVVSYVYLDRLAQQRTLVDGEGEEEEEEMAAAAVVGVVDSYSVHRLLITAVLVAAKFMDDMHYNNAYFARVGGVEVAEMNGLELELLFALRFRLNVTPDTFARYCAALEAHMLVPPPTPARTRRPSAADATTGPRCCWLRRRRMLRSPPPFMVVRSGSGSVGPPPAHQCRPSPSLERQWRWSPDDGTILSFVNLLVHILGAQFVPG